jgi:hypothetical protein
MSNPTSNFGWQMPTPTDLVTDLPADFEVFGQAVDTDFVDLLGGTTGQILSKTSATDLDFTWISPTAGDITGVTAGTGISGGGTSGTVTVTNDMATTITAAGDIVVGTGSGTYDNLPIGTTNQVLTADTTVSPYKVKWAAPSSGAMTKITTATFASTTSVSVDGCFTSTYANYVAYLTFTGDSAQATIDLRMRVGGVDDTNGYSTQAIFANGSTPEAGEDLGGTGLMRIGEHLEYTNGTKIEFYQPEIAKSTSITAFSQSHKSSGGNSPYITAGIHVDTTQFDGFKLSFGTQSGTVRVYGLEN